MKKVKLGTYIFLGIIFVIGISFLIVGTLKPKVAGMYIDTTPGSTVWLNGVEVGRTPYRDTIKPGETVIKLLPITFGNTLLPYETKVRLAAGVETVIRYDFGNSDDASAGDVISFEKIESGVTSLVAVTIPDSTQLTIDGGGRATTPHKTSSITPGEHILKFSAVGYDDREVKVKTIENYKLTAIIKLARAGTQATTPTPTQVQISSSPTPTIVVNMEQVEVLGTDIGYVRVRAEASSQSAEVGKVEPGIKYPLLETDPRNGWFKIEFEKPGSGETVGKSGWISNQYARRVGGTPTPRPRVATPSATTVQIPTSPQSP